MVQGDVERHVHCVPRSDRSALRLLLKKMSSILDDRDPDIIYSAGWTQGGSATEYNSTTMYTDQAGANMTITFQGTGIGVYGTIGSSNSNRVPPQTTYQLDAGSDVTYIPELTTSAQHYQRFYQSAQVSNGNHTLLVTNIIGGCDPYFVDYLVIQTGSNSTSSTTSSMPTGSTGQSNTGHRTAVIAGSVFGVIGGILLFALAYYFLIRRRWKRELGASVAAEEVSHHDVSPFQGNLPMSKRLASDNPNSLVSTQRNSVVAPPAYTPEGSTILH